MSLLLHASIRHPELPLFPSNVHNLLPDGSSQSHAKASILKPIPRSMSRPTVNGSANGTPRSQQLTNASGSEIDPSEAQLLGEMTLQRSAPAMNQAASTSNLTGGLGQADEYEDDYDTDPPAHYPKAGNGLARALRPESEDLQWLVDDNFEVFSHSWKGDGSGIGADGVLVDTMEGIDAGKA